jgi:hypothetical protein
MKRIAGVVFASLVAAGAAQAEFVRPITSPTLVDSPDTGFTIHPIVIHQALPDQVNTELGNLPVGGDFQVYAVQLEYAFNQDLSLIAVKDGYIDFNPDDTFAEESGWADLAAGLKYVFHRSEDTVASVKLVAELPTGDDEAWQGNGDGAIDPAVAAVTKIGKLQLQGTIGYIQAINDERSSELYNSWHASYEIADGLFPVIELNHVHVTDAGDGGARFDAHVDGGVPSVARFEGGDLVNLGASNADDNADFISVAVGLRYNTCSAATVGIAYEVPLTGDEDSLMDHRITADVIIKL